MKKSNFNPTDSELEILQVLWELGEARVKDVHARLQRRREIGYTTVLKLMQIMYEKNLVSRQTEGKGHIYAPSVEKERVQDNFLNKIIDKVYKGSTASMVMSALGNHSTSKEELEQIKAFIRQQEQNHS